MRLRSNAPDANAPARQLDEEEHVAPDQGKTLPNLRRKQVGSGDATPVGLQEGRPRHTLAALWSGFDAVRFENVRDGSTANLMPQNGERSHDCRETPPRIFLRHAHRQLSNLVLDARAARSTPPAVVHF